ncbi:MAG TPA: AAA family ATPase [Acidimicrobiales bacterium]|nr:AAA family ATPase [Acidimicrobiales bacterium]
MTVSRLRVRNYRSLVYLELPLGALTVICGENATGKTNLYRALLLLSRGADGALARTLLAEGGMPSVLWAGQPSFPGTGKRRPLRVQFGIELDGLNYELSLGLPSVDPESTPFSLDSEVKEEVVWVGHKRTRHNVLLDRGGTTAIARDANGETAKFVTVIDPFEPVLGQLGEPARFPELFDLRERLRRWRFYHHFPTEPGAPARFPRPGVRTPVLADDGHDLAAALATIEDIGNGLALSDAISDAFPGGSLRVVAERGTFSLEFELNDLRRAMQAHELSDGTLRYLYLVAALLTPRPPELLVLNEPETSLHTNLIGPLASLICEAARYSQVVVTTHSTGLAERLARSSDAVQVGLVRNDDGSTAVVD